MKLISICVPAYKAEKYLTETLESVRRQDYTEWELIVTEDGSRDSTQQLVEAFAKTVTQSVRYTRHELNKGLPATRNTGILHAKSDWIALLDSDDLWTPEHLSSLSALATQDGPVLLHGGSRLFDSDTGQTLEDRVPSKEAQESLPLSLYQGDYIIQPSSVLLHRSAWEQAGRFDPAFRYVEDRDMWLRCLRQGVKFRYSGKVSCLYRKHATALTKNAWAMAEASARAYDKQLDWEQIPKALRVRTSAEAWLSAGRLARATQPAQARACFAKSLRLRPNLRTLAYYMLSLRAARLRRGYEVKGERR